LFHFHFSLALNSVFSFIKMSDRDLKFVYIFCQTDTFLFVIETPIHKCKHPFSRNEHLLQTGCLSNITSMSVSGLPTFLISVKNLNLLSSSIYKHLKAYLIKHKQSLVLGECGSQLISVLSNSITFGT
jgi:hypothetical protein